MSEHLASRSSARPGSRCRRPATAGSSGSSRCSPTGSRPGHDVTLFASGDSRTKAKLAYVFEQAPSEQIGRTLPELQHALSALRARRRVRRDQRPHRPARRRARRARRDAGRAHGARAARRRARRGLRVDRARRAGGRADLDLAEPAQAEAGPELDRELPERARPRALPVPAAPRATTCSSSAA